MNLRALRWTDIDRLVELEQAAFGAHAWTAPTWWAELAARPRRDYVVVESEPERVVGYAGLDHGGGVADVMTIAVDPAAQGSGVGRVLLDELVHRAGSQGAEALLLEVRADNDRARALYESNGFEVISVRRRYYQPEGVDAVIMRRHLAEGEATRGC